MTDPTASQVKAARALLGWTQLALAGKARLGSATIADFERDKRTPNAATLRAIVLALERAGVTFIPGGVRITTPLDAIANAACEAMVEVVETMEATVPRYIARCSYGNDSIAMLQLLREHQLRDVTVVNNDTGWASEDWPKRVAEGEEWVRSLGWEAVTLPSKGFEAGTLNQSQTGMFPTRLRKWCTKELKIRPFLAWAKDADPDKRAIVCVGVRRAESVARRGALAFMPEQDNGRHVWHPLVEFTDADRDGMILKTPFPVLPHRSDECAICINSNRSDIRRAKPRDIDRVRALEQAVGRPMFNPAKFQGAEGIDEVKRWADSERGQYRSAGGVAPEYPLSDAMLDQEPATCEDNWCGL